MSQHAQQQDVPGVQSEMTPVPDCSERSYVGHDRLAGKAAVITGGDSGIGRAVAIVFGREGADVLIAYLDEDHDAHDTASLIEETGRKTILVRGDVSDAQHCRTIVAAAIDAFGKIDILVNNAAYRMTCQPLEEIPHEEWDYTFKTNISAMFHLTKAAMPHMGGRAIDHRQLVRSTPTYPPPPGSLRSHQGGHRQVLGQPGPDARRPWHSSQQRRPRTHLDAAHPRDNARKTSRELRLGHPARPSWPAS
jgi:NAD(P)-dependent dehydrogenase (short-subunit alcohol dehydrogenase family)